MRDPQQSAPPTAPFDRLLWRLDHAPLDLPSLARSAERGESLRQSARSYESAIAPVAPLLLAASGSKALTFAARLPLVGEMAQHIKRTLDAMTKTTQGFSALLRLDGAYGQPVRKALGRAERIRRTRQSESLPETYRDFDEAHCALKIAVEGLAKQQDRLASVEQGLVTLRDRHRTKQVSPATPGLLDRTKARVQAIRNGLGQKSSSLKGLTEFVGNCRDDVREAMET